MLTLIVNAGSSSLKTSLFDREKLIGHYHYEKIGKDTRFYANKTWSKVELIDPGHALRHNIEYLKNKNYTIAKVVHRVVHGGEFYNKPALITGKVKERIAALRILAPLHNPNNLDCIERAELLLPEAKHVAIFDTAYHQTLKEAQYRYGLPEKYYTKYKIRKYGFHGISHKYLAHEAMSAVKKKKIITCHLGNGSSITANLNGKSVDTSMGFTPLDGVIMGTRSGHIDPEIPLYLQRHLHMKPQQVYDILHNESGLLGLSGEQDVRDIQKKRTKKAKLALEKLGLDVKKYIGQYHAELNGAEAIVFSGGIGEKSWRVRELALSGLENLGIKLDKVKNKRVTKPKAINMIHARSSKVKILVIPANEELQMLKDAKKV